MSEKVKVPTLDIAKVNKIKEQDEDLLMGDNNRGDIGPPPPPLLQGNQLKQEFVNLK